jgi:hypothetical protein
MNFRRWNLTTHDSYTFDILGEPDALRAGWSLPEESTRVQDKDHQEIFHNDLVEINDNIYWVRYQHGGYLLELTYTPNAKGEGAKSPGKLKPGGNLWLHDAVREEAEIKIVGNSHQHADYLVQHINYRRTLTSPNQLESNIQAGNW